MNARTIFNTASLAALALAAGLVVAQAQTPPEVDHSKMDHSKMGHGMGAPVQWADPGKAQTAPGAAAPAEAPKADEHAGHHGGGDAGGMKGMNHGGGGMMGGGMGGMGGMMGGMNHGGASGGMDHGAGGASGGMSHGGSGGGMGGMMSNMLCGFAEHLDGRLAYLKAELKLTDQQTAAWNTFADAWRGVAQKAQAKCAAKEEAHDHAKPAVLGKLDMMDKHMSDHLEIVRAQKAAIEPLFGALSDEQKKIASETMTGMMKVGSMMGGGGMGGMMGGMNHGGSGGGAGGMQH